MSIFPFDRMRQRCLSVIIFVWFDIGFIFQVNTVFVTQIIPIRIIRVVRITYMVDIGTFHHHDFVFHHFAGDGMSHTRIGFMTVDTFQFYRFTVYIIVTSGQSEFIFRCGSIFDFHFTETDMSRNSFECTSFFIFQFSHQCIEVWFFSRPFIGLLYFQSSFGCYCLTGFHHSYRSRDAGIVHFGIVIGIQLVGIQWIYHRIAFGSFLSEVADICIDF